MIRVTSAILYRSGAQALVGERRVRSITDPVEFAEVVAGLTTAALLDHGEEIASAGVELVLRLAARQFECFDEPLDRKAKMSAPRPKPAVEPPSASQPPRRPSVRF
jgi:hypothetical protein